MESLQKQGSRIATTWSSTGSELEGSREPREGGFSWPRLGAFDLSNPLGTNKKTQQHPSLQGRSQQDCFWEVFGGTGGVGGSKHHL